MRKKGFMFSLMMVLMLVFSVPSFASSSNSNSGLDIPSTNSSTSLDLSTVDKGRFSKGMDALTKDAETVGGKMAYPLFFFCLIVGIILMVCGIFSKKLLALGGLALVIGFGIMFVLGDLRKAVDYMDYVATTIRNYF